GRGAWCWWGGGGWAGCCWACGAGVLGAAAGFLGSGLGLVAGAGAGAWASTAGGTASIASAAATVVTSDQRTSRAGADTIRFVMSESSLLPIPAFGPSKRTPPRNGCLNGK